MSGRHTRNINRVVKSGSFGQAGPGRFVPDSHSASEEPDDGAGDVGVSLAVVHSKRAHPTSMSFGPKGPKQVDQHNYDTAVRLDSMDAQPMLSVVPVKDTLFFETNPRIHTNLFPASESNPHSGSLNTGCFIAVCNADSTVSSTARTAMYGERIVVGRKSRENPLAFNIPTLNYLLHMDATNDYPKFNSPADIMQWFTFFGIIMQDNGSSSIDGTGLDFTIATGGPQPGFNIFGDDIATGTKLRLILKRLPNAPREYRLGPQLSDRCYPVSPQRSAPYNDPFQFIPHASLNDSVSPTELVYTEYENHSTFKYPVDPEEENGNEYVGLDQYRKVTKLGSIIDIGWVQHKTTPDSDGNIPTAYFDKHSEVKCRSMDIYVTCQKVTHFSG